MLPTDPPTRTHAEDDEPSTTRFAPRQPLGRPSPMAEMARGDSIDRYIVLDRLGAGGMGVVVAAYDPKLDRRVAIKWVRGRAGTDPEALHARLLREAQALARVDDPHVLRIYDVGTYRGRVYLSTELVAGRDLAAWLADGDRSRTAVLEVFQQAGRGLAAAHAAGLVHRDVKPSNLMVRDDGRAVVVDFGLARETAAVAPDTDGEAPATDSSTEIGDAMVVPLDELDQLDRAPDVVSPMADDLTVRGARLGTPAYMAPEQWRGEPVTAAADQFAFCVALHRALTGELPFTEATEDGQDPWGVRSISPDLPVWLRQPIARGLASDPEHRHPSMTALLRQIDPVRRRRRSVLGGLALIAVLAIGTLVWMWPSPPSCDSSPERLAGTWDPLRRQDLMDALATTDRPYAAAVAASTAAALDDYAVSWLDGHQAACEATRVHAEQSPALLDRRMACLDVRRREMAALVDLLVGDPECALDRALDAVAGLSSVAACTDAEAFVALMPPPDDPESVRRLDQVRDGLASARASYAAGLYAPGADQVDTVLDAARTIGYPPTIAEALLLQGALLGALGEGEAARAALDESLDWSTAGRDDRTTAEAFVRLVRLAGSQRADTAEGARFVELAHHVIDRLGEGDELAAALADHEASLHLQAGDLDAARTSGERAVALKTDLFGDDHPAVARSLLRLGEILDRLGEIESARDLLARSLDIQRRHLGDRHPDVGLTLDRLATAERELGRVDLAIELHQQALEILRQRLGDHPHTATALTHLGNAAGAAGDAEAALGYQAEALAVYERTVGEDHPHSALARGNWAAALAQAGRRLEARRAYRDVIEIQRRLHGDEHPWVAISRFNLAETLNDLEDHAAALDLHRQALASWRASYGDAHPLIDHGLIGEGRALAGLGQWQGAARRLESAWRRLADRTAPDPLLQAEAGLELARAWWRTGRRADAIAIAEEAALMIDGVDDPLRDKLATWRAEHSLPEP